MTKTTDTAARTVFLRFVYKWYRAMTKTTDTAAGGGDTMHVKKGGADGRGAISSAICIGSFGKDAGQLAIRGWHPTPGEIERIEIRSPSGEVLGETQFDEERPDVAKTLGSDPTLRYGFNVLIRGAGASVDAFEVHFVDEKGVSRSVREAKSNKIADFEIKSLVYDEPTRRLTYLGRFSPNMQCRSVVLATKNQDYQIGKIFEKDPETDGGRFEWFYGEANRLPPNDLRTLGFVFSGIDGKKHRIDLSELPVSRNPSTIEIEVAKFDFLRGIADVNGWFRTFDDYTHVTLTVGDQPFYCIPTVGVSRRIQERRGFAGPMPMGWNVSIKNEVALDDVEVLLANELPFVTARLMKRETVLATHKLKLVGKNVISTGVDLCLHSLETSHLVLFGRSTDLRIKAIRVTRRDQFVTRTELISLSREDIFEPDSQSSWGWVAISEINARLLPGEVLDIEYLDAAGEPLGSEGPTPIDLPVLSVTAPRVIEGHPKVADLVLRLSRQPRPSALPMLMLVFPGSMAAGGGGGNARVRELLGFLKSCGFQIALIDRSELWDIVGNPEGYRDLMSCVDFHVPLGPSYATDLANQTVKLLAGRPDSHSKMLHDRLKSAIEKGRNGSAPSLIERRTDEVFNQLASCYAHHYRPRIFLTSFVWTSSALETLTPGIIKMLDAHDVQSARYNSFLAAQERYGEEVIGPVDSFNQDEEAEAKALNRADVVLAISPSEATTIAKMVGTHKTVHAGFSLHTIEPMAHVEGSRKILFVGNKYIPNTHGIESFVKDVFPDVRRIVGDAELHVCGSVCEELALRIGEPEGVFLRGFVPDLEVEYASAAVVINPVQFGSGTSIKTPEALGYGKAVVCTPYIAKSLPHAEDAGAVVVADLAEMASPIARLLVEEDERRRLEARAVSYAGAHLTSETVLADLLNIIETKIFY